MLIAELFLSLLCTPSLFEQKKNINKKNTVIYKGSVSEYKVNKVSNLSPFLSTIHISIF